ncbi:MAG TPA: 6-phosphofructokinase, partial [Candidatus Latescibacteria bacterium]|nr:6-phosphofructokinase [Candidatus Latescibacterota bacterium]
MQRIGVMTSGGDAPGMNANVRAIVRTGIFRGVQVFGIRDGFAGLISDEIIPMTSPSVGGIVGRGGTILGT